jgi:hypothetical protein
MWIFTILKNNFRYFLAFLPRALDGRYRPSAPIGIV